MATATTAATKAAKEALEKGGLILHGGVFHADDVFVAAWADIFCPGVKISRAFKVPEGFEGVVADIGASYDPDKMVFDHHQSGAPVAEDGHKMCSFEQIVSTMCSLTWQKAWKALAEDISRTDNGESEYRAGICMAVHAYNPTWDQPGDPESQMKAFREAMRFAKSILMQLLDQQEAADRAKAIVEAAIAKAKHGVAVLEQYVPFAESVAGRPGEVNAVVFPSNRGGYMVQIPNTAPGSFDLVGHFGEMWTAGYRSCTFVHAAGFCGNCSELSDAIDMASSVVLN